ncbi:hypothetical protein [Yoonia sp. MH D7]
MAYFGRNRATPVMVKIRCEAVQTAAKCERIAQLYWDHLES